MDFVTVCFCKDLPQMKLQAASMDRFLQAFDVGRILVIVNDDDAAGCMDYLRSQVLPLYGRLQDRVEMLDGDQLLEPPDRNMRAYRYFNQMLLKLVAADLCDDPHYCILDAKNWLAADWYEENVWDRRGRLRAKVRSLQEQWQDNCERSFAYVGLDHRNHRLLAQHTGFFAHTDVVRWLLRHPNFQQQFRRQALVEFPLIQAATIRQRGSWEEAYWVADDDSKQTFWSRYCTCIWPLDCKERDQQDDLEWYLLWTRDKILTTGVHRDCFSILSQRNLDLLKSWWVGWQLTDAEGADQIIAEMQQLNPPAGSR